MEGVAGLIALAIAAGALVVATVAMGMARSSKRAADASPAGVRTTELERRLGQLSQRLEVLEADVDAHRKQGVGEARPVSNAIRGTGAAITHVGLVRFDAFEDAGGAQSFALALLDDDADGFILTSLHSRPTTRVYVKSIRGGAADAPLSGEEEQALKEAGLTL